MTKSQKVSDDSNHFISMKYLDREFAQKYEKERFGSPFGIVMHNNQVAFIREAIRHCPNDLALEVAPGPFRIAKDLSDHQKGVQLDSSLSMLQTGRTVCRNRKLNDNWEFVAGSASVAPFFDNSFDIVIVFRFLWHFDRERRLSFLKEFNRILTRNGTLVFDFPATGALGRGGVNTSSDSKIPAYSISQTDLRDEITEAGFTIVASQGNMWCSLITKCISGLHRIGLGFPAVHIIEFFERMHLGVPDEWLICCRRK